MQIAQLVASLLTALAWPVVALIALIYFGSDVRTFVKTASEMRLKLPGLEGSLTRQLESAAALGAAKAKPTDSSGSTEASLTGAELRRIADTIEDASGPSATRRLSGSNVLWVDDRPANNTYERASLEALGIRVTISTSTDDGVAKLHTSAYDAVISDMGRPPDPQAGYTLLGQLKRMGIAVPFIIYSGSNLPEHRVLALTRGAVGSTNDPHELFQMVIAAILGQAIRSRP